MDSSGAETGPRETTGDRSLSGGSFHQNCASLDALKCRGSKLFLPRGNKGGLLVSKNVTL